MLSSEVIVRWNRSCCKMLRSRSRRLKPPSPKPDWRSWFRLPHCKRARQLVCRGGAPILAEARDGTPLPSKQGPVQIVAPCDLTHARWVRGVTQLTVIVSEADHRDD